MMIQDARIGRRQHQAAAKAFAKMRTTDPMDTTSSHLGTSSSSAQRGSSSSGGTDRARAGKRDRPVDVASSSAEPPVHPPLLGQGHLLEDSEFDDELMAELEIALLGGEFDLADRAAEDEADEEQYLAAAFASEDARHDAPWRCGG